MRPAGAGSTAEAHKPLPKGPAESGALWKWPLGPYAHEGPQRPDRTVKTASLLPIHRTTHLALPRAVLWPVFDIVFRSLGGSRPPDLPGWGAAAPQAPRKGFGGRQPPDPGHYTDFVSRPKAWHEIFRDPLAKGIQTWTQSG